MRYLPSVSTLTPSSSNAMMQARDIHTLPLMARLKICLDPNSDPLLYKCDQIRGRVEEGRGGVDAGR